jgi:thiol-disulfide isomerase/thioredoxin
LWGLLCLAWAVGPAGAAGAATPESPPVGSLAPDFKAHNLLTGERTLLSSQQGKVVIVTFWATWCGPCRRELPILEKVQRLLGKDKLTVFAVSFHEKPEATFKLERAVKDWQINLIEDPHSEIADHYAISSIPHLFLIGRDGKILASHVGYGERSIDDLVADINGALAEPQDGAQTPIPAPTS